MKEWTEDLIRIIPGLHLGSGRDLYHLASEKCPTWSILNRPNHFLNVPSARILILYYPLLRNEDYPCVCNSFIGADNLLDTPHIKYMSYVYGGGRSINLPRLAVETCRTCHFLKAYILFKHSFHLSEPHFPRSTFAFQQYSSSSGISLRI